MTTSMLDLSLERRYGHLQPVTNQDQKHLIQPVMNCAQTDNAAKDDEQKDRNGQRILPLPKMTF